MSYKQMKFIKGNKLLLGVISILILFIAIQTVYAVSKLETDVKPFGYVTSTPEYITANTETVTTDTIDLLGIDQVDMKIQETASSTKSVLVWEYEYSDDNIDWFGEDLAEATATTTGQGNTISHSTTTPKHTWAPGTTSTVRKNVVIKPIASRYMRVKFSSTASSSAIWIRFALKQENRN